MSRTKAEIIARINEIGITTRFCNGSCPSQRVKDVGEIDEKKRKVPFIAISEQNAGERYDWWEDETYIEEIDIAGVNTDRLKTFFKDHRCSVDTAIGRIENIQKNKDLRVDVIFGRDEESDKIFQKYRDGILTDVSIGYVVRDIVVTEKKNEPTHVLITKLDVIELSAVWMGFDAGSGRSEKFGTIQKSSEQNEIQKRLKKLKEKELS